MPSIRSVCACLLEFHLLCARLLCVNFVVNHVFDVVEWDKATHQVAAHCSSFGELVCLFIAPMSYVSFYLFKLYCVFVCKFGESFMAVIDVFVVVYFIGESL